MRGMGDITAYLRRGIREIICLALFFFTFLACEYLFDVRMVFWDNAYCVHASINKKTGTASRVSLINFFWSWTPKD